MLVAVRDLLKDNPEFLTATVRGSSSAGSVIGGGSGTGAGAGGGDAGDDAGGGDDAVAETSSDTLSTGGIRMRGGGEVGLDARKAFLLLKKTIELRDIRR